MKIDISIISIFIGKIRTIKGMFIWGERGKKSKITIIFLEYNSGNFILEDFDNERVIIDWNTCELLFTRKVLYLNLFKHMIGLGWGRGVYQEKGEGLALLSILVSVNLLFI